MHWASDGQRGVGGVALARTGGGERVHVHRRDDSHVVTSEHQCGAVQITSASGGMRDSDITHSAPKLASPVQLI
ncbi:MAG: hypothetical protein ACRDRT_00415 [Pseudonocardiaceae bacterium]